MNYKEKKIKEFEEWCKNTTATFETSCPVDENDWAEDFNVSFSELSFYNRLIEKFSQTIDELEAKHKKEIKGLKEKILEILPKDKPACCPEIKSNDDYCCMEVRGFNKCLEEVKDNIKNI